MGPGDFYTMFSLEGRNTGAAYTLRQDQKAHGVPPNWMLYIAVDSADATAAKAVQLGGKIIAPGMDVMDAGRMAVIMDPTGAIFSVWQSKKHSGTGITGVEGTLCWADLSTPDQARAGKFYADLFGWHITKEDEDPAHNYWHVKLGEDFIGGIPPDAHRDPKTPPYWLIYIQVSNCAETAAKARELGANIYMPPTDFENIGRIAVMADPQGAAFALFQSAKI
jgi:predicted enzyme related to lactoylglutathione lyase